MKFFGKSKSGLDATVMKPKNWTPKYFKPFNNRPKVEPAKPVDSPFGGGTFIPQNDGPYDPHPEEDIGIVSDYWANLTKSAAQDNPGNWVTSLPVTRRNYLRTRRIKSADKLDRWVEEFTQRPKYFEVTASYGPMYDSSGDLWGMFHNPYLSEAQVLKLAGGNNDYVCRIAAVDPRLPAAGVDGLILLGPRVRELLARRDDLSIQQQIRLLNDRNTEVQVTIRLNPTVSEEVKAMAALVQDKPFGEVDWLPNN